MWDRWKNVIVGRPPDSRPTRAAPPSPYLSALPPLPVGHPDGIAAVSPSLLSGYLGQQVTRIEPLPRREAALPIAQHRTYDTRSTDTRSTRWRVWFDNGSAASIELHPINDPRAVFPVLQSRYIVERSSRVTSPGDDLSMNAVCTIPEAPYESYYQGTVLTARGGVYEALVTTCSPGGPLFHRTMAGVAAVALRMIDD